MKKKVFLTLIIVVLGGIISTAGASDISINGFIQGNYSANLQEPNPDGDDFKWREERVQLKISASKDPFYLFLKTDLSYDHLDNEADLELREAYLDYVSDSWDLRVGRQIITWGVGDLIFINDVFPKDYIAFFSGRPMEYLKKGVDSLKIGIYPSFASVELVIIPFFESDVYPLYPHERFWVYDPKPHILEPRKEIEPEEKIENTELALRIYRDISAFDVSLYFYRGFYRRPFWLPDKVPGPTKMDYYHPELSVYGASLQGRALGGVISLEGGFYDSPQDRDGTDPVVPNQTTRFLLGYQRQLWEDLTAGIQYYIQYMLDYDEFETARREKAPGCPSEKRIRRLITLRLTHLFMHQTLKFSFFSFWSPEGDYMFKPEVEYHLSDHIWASLGANIFGGGKVWSQFGQLRKDDNIYTVVRYEF